jgi:hypothetical protein
MTTNDMTSNGIEETTRVHTYLVDPERLNSGLWCHKVNKTVGEGDIAASYSADRIAMNRPIRRTFPWQGSEWVCVCLGYNGVISAEAYRLVEPRLFSGKPLSYTEKTSDADSVRADTNGFYHGMTVKDADGRSYFAARVPVLNPERRRSSACSTMRVSQRRDRFEEQ